MMINEQFLKGILTALGIGLLIGVVRERRHAPDSAEAGIRTHLLVALLGAISWQLGLFPFVASFVILGSFIVSSYLRTSQKDPGLTGEVIVLVNFILAGLALKQTEIAAALGVLSAIILQSKKSIHWFSRELINEQEISDVFLLLASTLIIMPLLPSEPIDQWGAINLSVIWKIVVLIMATGILGHIARRAFGTHIGLSIAGFFSGLASSTAAIASFGQKAKAEPQNTLLFAASALMANLASLLLFMGIILTISKNLFYSMIIPFSVTTLSQIIISVLMIIKKPKINKEEFSSSGQAFKITHALIIAGAIGAVSFVSGWINANYGSWGVIITCIIAATAEIHATGATLGQLTDREVISLDTAQWGVLGAIISSSIAKMALSYFSGGRDYCAKISRSLLFTVGLTCLSMLFI